ncbi:MAG: hypothetical protein GY754_31750 [bacterium]|nr:hypothetical protein [bacterium]
MKAGNKKIFYSSLFILAVLVLTLPSALFAEKKLLYVNPFLIETGINQNDPIGDTIANHMVSVFASESSYDITTQDSHRAQVAKMEIKQTFGEEWAKQLMKKMNAHALVFGRVKKTGNNLLITAKILKRYGKSMRLHRIKTIKIRSRYPVEDKHTANDIKRASRALAVYLLDGDDDDIEDFLDDMYERVEDRLEAKEKKEIRGKINEEDRRFDKEIREYAMEKESEILRYNSLLRFGYGGFSWGVKLFNTDLGNYYPQGMGVFVDLILTPKNSASRIKGTSTRARHDFYVRVFYKQFVMSSSVEIKSLEAAGSDDIVSKGTINMYGADLGYRNKFLQFYFLMTSFEVYMSAAVRYQYYDESAANPLGGDDFRAVFHSIGGYVGLGLELAFFENIGLFGEYNIGFTPVGESWTNTEGHQVYFGITYRAEPFYY